MSNDVKLASNSPDPHHLKGFPYGPTWFDQLALAAMQAIITASSDEHGNIEYDEKHLAENAYAMAAAMLDERVNAHQQYAAKHYK